MDGRDRTLPIRQHEVNGSGHGFMKDFHAGHNHANTGPLAGFQDVAEDVATGVGGAVQNVRGEINKVGHQIDNPGQVESRHTKFVRRLGQVGWVAKGVVYAILGGLACKSAAQGQSQYGADASPQGAFILVGANNAGVFLLIVMALGVATYTMWRLWEGITGQGYDATFSTFNNFFKFRLSPIVSGVVYALYLFFILSIIPDVKKAQDKAETDPGFPNGWGSSVPGRIGLFLLGVGFGIGAIVQFLHAVTDSIHSEYRDDLREEHPQVLNLVLRIGHTGFIGRAFAFGAVSALFFRQMAHETSSRGSTIARGLYQLQGHWWGRALMFIVGALIIVYAIFAVLSSWARIFPTPPPSRKPKLTKQLSLRHETVSHIDKGHLVGVMRGRSFAKRETGDEEGQP